MFHLQRFITWVLIVLTFSHGFPEKFLTTPWKEDADGSGSAAAAVAERLLAQAIAQAIAQTDDLETQCVCGCPDKVLMRQNPTYKSYKYCQRGPKETQDSAPEWNLAFHSSCVLHQCVFGTEVQTIPSISAATLCEDLRCSKLMFVLPDHQQRCDNRRDKIDQNSTYSTSLNVFAFGCSGCAIFWPFCRWWGWNSGCAGHGLGWNTNPYIGTDLIWFAETTTFSFWRKQTELHTQSRQSINIHKYP